MTRKFSFLAMLALVAASFTACCDFPIDPYPVDPDPIDTLDNGGPGNGGGGCGDSVIVDPWPDDSVGIQR